MKFKRSSGVLLHPTSLPGKYGIGDLGKDAFRFVDFLAASGQTLWQVFPLGPTGYGDSPYQCFSAFAGNHLLISPELLMQEGLLTEEDLAAVPAADDSKVDFGKVIDYKSGLLIKAFENLQLTNDFPQKEYASFCRKNSEWLDDYALFMAVKKFHGGIVWRDWSRDIAFRKEGAVKKWTERLKGDVEFFKFTQFEFNKQWMKLKKYANEKGIDIIGDLPIFIAYDSADLWANKELFTVNKKGRLQKVAGVPPDYFSETGQLWGNPLYKWDVMERNNFKWWKKRFANLFNLVDTVRIDHFRGFDAYWEIPGDAETAINGRWVKAPGKKLFKAVRKTLGNLPIIAEDLGVITKEVEELRDFFDFPGIKILQFAFGPGGEKKFLPHNFQRNCVVHTGSHDNDTTRAFFEKMRVEAPSIYEHAVKYLNHNGDNLCEELIRSAYASVADMVVIPLQDILNLGGEARMNFPGTAGGNWTWRFKWEQLNNELIEKYKEMSELYDRPPKNEQQYDEIITH